MFSQLFLLLISSFTSCLNYKEFQPGRCSDCLDPNSNTEMTNFFKENSAWDCSDEAEAEPTENNDQLQTQITVDHFLIKSYVKHHYASTYVTNQITNRGVKKQQAVFSIFIPSRAFISSFIIEADNKRYKSQIEKRQNTLQNKPGHEGSPLRKFQVKTKLKPNETVIYHLVYDELLARKNGKYNLELNVHPGQTLRNLDVEVLINEQQPLRFVRTPLLITPGDVEKNNSALEPQAEITRNDKATVRVRFRPSIEQQNKFTNALEGNIQNGLDAQFRVHYDVMRNSPGGEVLLHGKNFVHFFAPEHLKPLPKFVIFVLDTSSSMHGVRIRQLKSSMQQILPQLKPDDLFTIIEFASNVFVVDVESKKGTKMIIKGSKISDYENFEKSLENKTIPAPVKPTESNVNQAIKHINKFRAGGSTNMISSLQLAIYMAKQTQKNTTTKYEQIIMFITDGEPTYRNQTKAETTEIVTKYNANIASIFSVAISTQAHYSFLKQLSSLNRGVALFIKNSKDISVLLKRFFNIYSTPVLDNIHFLYGVNGTTLTQKNFATFFEGTELVVAGNFDNLRIQPQVIANSQQGQVGFLPYVSASTTPLDRIWAYLKIHQNIHDLLKDNVSEKLLVDTLNLALAYSFVTPLSSLTVNDHNSGTIYDDLLLKPNYKPIKDLSSVLVVKDLIISQYVLPIELQEKEEK